MKQVLIIFSIVFMGCGLLFADEIHLEDRSILKGKIIRVTDSIIEYDPEGDIPSRILSRDDVVKFRYDDGKEVVIYNEDKVKGAESQYFFKRFKSNITEKGLHRNRVMVWGGTHKHLYGYTDERYLSCVDGDANCDSLDQGDYIAANSQQFGFELLVSDFTNVDPDLDDGRAGINICGYRHGEIEPVTLYAVPAHGIEEETVPGEEAGFEKNPKWCFNIGVFAGLDKKWYALDLGLTLKATIITEEKRKKLTPDSDPENPTYEEVKGRGMMFDESKVLMNALFRFGLEERPHFILSANRLDYDTVYGAVQGKICFPLWKYFGMNTGGYLYRTQAVFIEPVVKLGGFSLGYKTGVIINFHDEEFERAGIEDSLFHSVSLSCAW